ncbi:MAG TPA: hypothetical protein VGP82_15145 [Ktedonobacterales bacterium]|jgi:hypothetical protein|nr:hypothetical protein [Ktedonobacterales bacterium]
MFDPRIPYQRRMWHYESDRALSVAQLVALGSIDARTAALLWLLIERHQSLIVSGPTDPTPGVGKTTTLNALLGVLPAGTTLVYTLGMYEDFEFRNEVQPETTCVLANEVSDHLRIYMWGRVARRLLRLPEENYAVATSCHADTVQDVLSMLTRDLRLPAVDVRRLGVIVNIGLVGRLWPPQRRFLTVNFVAPTPSDSGDEDEIRLLPLATWDSAADTFLPASQETLAELAAVVGMPLAEFCAALDRRRTRMEELSRGRGVGVKVMRDAADALAATEHGEMVITGDSSSSDHEDE